VWVIIAVKAEKLKNKKNSLKRGKSLEKLSSYFN
jgi:hypothetical protein